MRIFRTKLKIKMARVLVVMRIMPESPDVDLGVLEKEVKEKIEEFEGKITKSEIIPVAFGLKAIDITFLVDEAKGDTEPLENALVEINGVNSAEVTYVTRAVG
ncbi:MAG: elongation factor 1-beta [Candidatus Woesearchaeota archaeon]